MHDSNPTLLQTPDSISYKGIAGFSGKPVNVVLQKANHNTILFQRIDLPHKPCIEACLSNVHSTNRRTVLGKETEQVALVEHLLSAAFIRGVKGLSVLVDGPELPIGDGSAFFWVELLQKLFPETVFPFSHVLKEPVVFQKEQAVLLAIPDVATSFSYTLYHPQSSFIGTQQHTFHLQKDCYETEISPARTFCLYEEIEPWLKQGYFQGLGLENGIVIKENQLQNEKLRFSNEMARHKVLDLIGDLSLLLLHKPFVARFIAICSGHSTNVLFAKKLDLVVKGLV